MYTKIYECFLLGCKVGGTNCESSQLFHYSTWDLADGSSINSSIKSSISLYLFGCDEAFFLSICQVVSEEFLRLLKLAS